uniref:Tc1-like transposase DDE domain-containing protein n=1 Tax=Lates calcarifer TaxID=8187 RepID=A0A4W6FT44_LATCA
MRITQNKVLWADDTKTNLYQMMKREPKATASSVKHHGGSSLMVWAVIHYGGKTTLVVLDGNVNAVMCRNILENHCLPHTRRVYGNNFRLQDDNARAYRAATVRELLAVEGMQQMPWPACSPDMNPIEHAWDALGQREIR